MAKRNVEIDVWRKNKRHMQAYSTVRPVKRAKALELKVIMLEFK